MVKSRKGLLRNSHTRIDNFFPLIRLSTLYLVLDDGLDNLELKFVCGAGVGDSNILEEQVLRLLILMDDNSHVTPIVNNQFRSENLTIILRPYQDIRDTVPVLLENLTLTGKHSNRFVIPNDSPSVILRREMLQEHKQRSLLRRDLRF